jgi:hypothetical protein
MRKVCTMIDLRNVLCGNRNRELLCNRRLEHCASVIVIPPVAPPAADFHDSIVPEENKPRPRQFASIKPAQRPGAAAQSARPQFSRHLGALHRCDAVAVAARRSRHAHADESRLRINNFSQSTYIHSMYYIQTVLGIYERVAPLVL